MKRTDNKLTLIKVTFSVANYKLLSIKDVLNFNDSVRGLFHFADKFRDLNGVKNFVLIYMLEDLIQNTESDNCGSFQLYFFENLFGSSAESEIFEHKKLIKNTVEVLLKEISLSIENNKKIIEEYNEKKKIEFG